MPKLKTNPIPIEVLAQTSESYDQWCANIFPVFYTLCLANDVKLLAD